MWQKKMENKNKHEIVTMELFITVIVMWLQKYLKNKHICYNKMIVYSDGDFRKKYL